MDAEYITLEIEDNHVAVANVSIYVIQTILNNGAV